MINRSISALHLLTPIKSNAVRGAECKMMVSQLSISSLQNTQGAAPRLRPSILLETFTINLIHQGGFYIVININAYTIIYYVEINTSLKGGGIQSLIVANCIIHQKMTRKWLNMMLEQIFLVSGCGLFFSSLNYSQGRLKAGHYEIVSLMLWHYCITW